MSERSESLIAHEAAFLRAALLVGLVHEGDVSAWAQYRLTPLDASTRPAMQLTDLLLSEEALSPMREALRPLAASADRAQLTATLLAGISVDDALVSRSVADRLRVLGLLRREFVLPPDLVAAINSFIERAMLADAKVGDSPAPDTAQLQRWLRDVAPPAFFRFEFDASDEGAAFVAAVSRKLARDRTMRSGETGSGAVWVAQEGGRLIVFLTEASWRLTVREFAPLPIVSRIPALSLPANAVFALDERTTEPLGLEEAVAILPR